ncbi:uncharacterized protein RJT21DRAFT_118919 [Scheffersomyces amazonensis]|uniref:uncharacterized protein n=1 Tax=Scheffersomyces amazonensis TaxID=1078765 RepID=UPI00315CFAA5
MSNIGGTNSNNSGRIGTSSLTNSHLSSHNTLVPQPNMTDNIPHDAPPDLRLLLQTLENDFHVNRTIDQYTYINGRENILRNIERLRLQQQQQHHQSDIQLDPEMLEPPIYPRLSSSSSSELNADDNELTRLSLVDILEKRSKLQRQDEEAFISLDSKGKRVNSITWTKLYLKAMKLAYDMHHKLSLRNGNCVFLIYKDGEVIEFVVALFACFMIGATAIPIYQDISLDEVMVMINNTSSRLLLYSESVAKRLEVQSLTLKWPSKLVRWKTNDLGSAKPHEQSEFKSIMHKMVAESKSTLAYVEFSRSSIGELRGVALSHRTILHQMNSLELTLSSMPDSGGGLQRSIKEYRPNRKVVLGTLDIRISIGLIIGVLFTVYTGNVLIWSPQVVMEIPGLYAHIVTKYRAAMLLADNIGLKQVTYDYQKSPNSTRYFSKTQSVDFSHVRWVLVNASTVDGEFADVLSQRFLRPLGCKHPQNAVIPMLTLSGFGGMVISLRDWLGGQSQSYYDNPTGDDQSLDSDLSSVLIDKDALTRNIVKIVEVNPPPADDIPKNCLRVDSFGFPLPDATLAVVNPESSILVSKGELGEIWIDSPCLSGGFYKSRNESKQIFHAKCRGAEGILQMDFLRTGLLGFTFRGKVYILGLYEDRVRQRVSWIDQRMYSKLKKELILGNGYRYHYSSHLLSTVATEVRQVHDCTIFDIFIGNEHLPVAIVETVIARKTVDDNNSINTDPKASPSNKFNETESLPANEGLLNMIAEKCFDALYRKHYLRLYCVVVVDCDSLPRIMRSGGREIASLLCRKWFIEGRLDAQFVKFFANKSVSMIPHGEDPIGGIWSPYSSQLRSAALSNFPDQYSKIDYRSNSIDDKTKIPLTDFKSIVDILKMRVANSGDSIAFQSVDNSGKNSKPLTWKKFEHRVYAVCNYLIEKAMIRPGRYVILMYSLSEEFIISLYACLICGIIPIPVLPFDSNRIGEDLPAFVGVLMDFDVAEILVNDEIEKFLKTGSVSDSIKKYYHRASQNLRIKNTAKLTKVSNVATLLSKISKYQAAVNYRDPNTIALIWLNFTSDHYRVGATLTHKTIIGICKVFKETCGLTSKSSIVGCVRHASGIGFIQSALLGVFLGVTTYLFSPVSYAENPLAFFLTLARNKVKDVFVTDQQLKYAVSKFTPKGFTLNHLKNMMISTDSRVEIELLREIAKVFRPTQLSAASLSTVYDHFFNPMISTRSNMTIAPVDLFLDPIALRQGYVSVVDQKEVPNALHIQDSGVVPVCTQVAIVNPETCRVCKEGEYGEIWVASEANLPSFSNGPKGPEDKFSKILFNGKIIGGDPNITYLRTGDLGFLHNISITKNMDNGRNNSHGGGMIESSPEQLTSFQPLFLLGKIADTFEVMGLHHFPIDIENTIESSHPAINKNGVCIFKCSDYTIVVCQTSSVKYFASLVPIIVNTVLSKHHLIVDIVAFIKRGEFPISRLRTKQRARIVDAWVKGFIPIIASYGINYGENVMLKLIKEIGEESKDDPFIGLKNPALPYETSDIDDIFDEHRQGLTLNQDFYEAERRAEFSISNYSTSTASVESVPAEI